MKACLILVILVLIFAFFYGAEKSSQSAEASERRESGSTERVVDGSEGSRDSADKTLALKSTIEKLSAGSMDIGDGMEIFFQALREDEDRVLDFILNLNWEDYGLEDDPGFTYFFKDVLTSHYVTQGFGNTLEKLEKIRSRSGIYGATIGELMHTASAADTLDQAFSWIGSNGSFKHVLPAAKTLGYVLALDDPEKALSYGERVPLGSARENYNLGVFSTWMDSSYDEAAKALGDMPPHRDLDDSMSWLISHSMTLFSEDITEEEVLLLQKWSEAIVDPTKKEEATSEIKNFNDRITQARKDAVGLHSR